MKIEELFAHPIGEVNIDYDNEKLIKSIENRTDDIQNNQTWQCEVVTSFQNPELNNQIFSEHSELLLQIQEAGNNFIEQVGWKLDDYFVEDFWFNVYANEHWQEQHHHGTHDFCGIYYVTPDVTPTIFMNPNDYSFHSRYNRTKKTAFTRQDYQSLSQPGKLVLFPGYMMHYVPYKSSSHINYIQRRMTIAVNFGKDDARMKKVLDIKKGV